MSTSQRRANLSEADRVTMRNSMMDSLTQMMIALLTKEVTAPSETAMMGKARKTAELEQTLAEMARDGDVGWGFVSVVHYVGASAHYEFTGDYAKAMQTMRDAFCGILGSDFPPVGMSYLPSVYLQQTQVDYLRGLKSNLLTIIQMTKGLKDKRRTKQLEPLRKNMYFQTGIIEESLAQYDELRCTTASPAQRAKRRVNAMIGYESAAACYKDAGMNDRARSVYTHILDLVGNTSRTKYARELRECIHALGAKS